jgi:hypothetical protein
MKEEGDPNCEKGLDGDALAAGMDGAIEVDIGGGAPKLPPIGPLRVALKVLCCMAVDGAKPFGVGGLVERYGPAMPDPLPKRP